MNQLACQRGWITAVGFLLTELGSWAQPTNLPPLEAPVPGLASSVLRMLGALAIVLALFLGGVWGFKNWQRLIVRPGKPAKLNVLEVKPLGHRHALYVVGYEQQRLLLAASPTGVTFLSHLPMAEHTVAEPAITSVNFTETLRQVLGRKP
jgi:flagellar biogenesis protein FliO